MNITHVGRRRRSRREVAPPDRSTPVNAARATAVVAGLVALTGLLALAALQELSTLGVFALPFAASVALVALAPSVSLAQPRALLLGHLSAALIALAGTALAGPSTWTASATTATAITCMIVLRAPHPPAAATAALIGLTGPDPWFLLPVLLASLLVIAVAALVGQAFPTRRYPTTWN
jgi:CBS-domain-containing membrane protein